MKILLAVFAVLCLAGSARAAWGASPCPNGWALFNETSCLSLLQQQETWEEARRQCAYQQPGSDLVQIDSKEKNQFIHTMVHASPPFLKCGLLGMEAYWIGANDKNWETWFEWLDTKQPLKYNYDNWGWFEPNNRWNEDCVEMEYEDGTWNDEDCGNKRCFMCEKPATK